METISAAAHRLPWKPAKFWKETNDLGQYSRALLLMTSKADKLPLETEPVARDNNTILTLNRGDQTLPRLTQLIIVVNLLKFCVSYNPGWNSFFCLSVVS